MSKHTPGPWRANFAIGGAAYVFGGDRNFALVFNEWQDKANQEANARLIAAAPELLEALERLRDAEKAPRSEWIAALANADSAIAKAKGSSHE